MFLGAGREGEGITSLRPVRSRVPGQHPVSRSAFRLQSCRLFSRQEAVKVVGKTLGHYEILEPLGKGGMCDMYVGEEAACALQFAYSIRRPGFQR